MNIRVRRRGHATWAGPVPGGKGRLLTHTRVVDAEYTEGSRVGDEPYTNPEELVAAAQAACFLMTFGHLLTKAGAVPTGLEANVVVQLDLLDDGVAITSIEIEVGGEAPGIDRAGFVQLAEQTKRICPVSKALAGTSITLSVLAAT